MGKMPPFFRIIREKPQNGYLEVDKTRQWQNVKLSFSQCNNLYLSFLLFKLKLDFIFGKQKF